MSKKVTILEGNDANEIFYADDCQGENIISQTSQTSENSITQDKKKSKKKKKTTKTVKSNNLDALVERVGKSIEKSGCSHKFYEDDTGLSICSLCSYEMQEPDYKPEWRFYGSSDNRSSKDPSRASRVRYLPKGVASVFEKFHLEIPTSVQETVNDKYNKICGGEVSRGNGRNAVVAACLFNTYKNMGYNTTSGEIADMFRLEKKKMSEGLAKYYSIFPNESTKNLTPHDLLRWVMKCVGIKSEKYDEICKYEEFLRGTHKIFERSTPQSVAAMIVYFYLCLNPIYKKQLGLKKSVFAIKVGTSEITLTKLLKIAGEVSDVSVC